MAKQIKGKSGTTYIIEGGGKVLEIPKHNDLVAIKANNLHGEIIGRVSSEPRKLDGGVGYAVQRWKKAEQGRAVTVVGDYVKTGVGKRSPQFEIKDVRVVGSMDKDGNVKVLDKRYEKRISEDDEEDDEEEVNVKGKHILESATVAGDAEVSGNAKVFHRAVVKGNAEVFGDAVVGNNAKVLGKAMVRGNAKVYHDAEVSGNAKVFDRAEVKGDAKVLGNAKVYGNADVYGEAVVRGNANVYGEAEVYGYANVYGEAEVFGDAKVLGRASVYGNAEVGGNAYVGGYARIGGTAKITGGNWFGPEEILEGTWKAPGIED